jgi:hypothetical protein
MRSIRHIAGLTLTLLVALACIAGLYVSAANRDIVVIDLLFWPSVSIRSGLLVTLAFASGALVGLLAAGVSAGSRASRRRWRESREGQRG